MCFEKCLGFSNYLLNLVLLYHDKKNVYCKKKLMLVEPNSTGS